MTTDPFVYDLTDELPPVITVQPADATGLGEELAAYHAHFAPLFARREQRAWAAFYLRGLLLADVPRKNIEAMALRLAGAGAAAGRTVRALQQFVGEGAWDDAALLAAHQRLVDRTLGEADGVLIIDGSDVPKRGRHSAGVAPQWCGATGKTDNCQAGVYLGYASRRGYTLLDRRLYLPQRWFSPEYAGRRQACAIPASIPFQTKRELALAMLGQVCREQTVRAQWLACDEWYGRDAAFRERVAACGLWYLAEVPADTVVWPLQDPATGQPAALPRVAVPPRAPSGKGRRPSRPRLRPESRPPQRVDLLGAQVPPGAWQRYRLIEGGKGPLVAEFLARRVVSAREGLPAGEGWLLVRRRCDVPEEERECKYYLSNAPAALPPAALVRVCGLRWPIESCFAEGKGELGLDQYEVRTWRGWHHHMTLVILAHHFLVRLQQRLNQREGGQQQPRTGGPAAAGGAAPRAAARRRHDQPGAGAPAPASGPAAAGPGRAGGRGAHRLPATAQAGGLPLPPPAHPAAPRSARFPAP
jgi:SRSO17 transposase